MQAYLSSVETQSGPITLAGIQRYCHVWAPYEIAPWASVTLVHGFGAHGGRFDEMGTALASLGLAVQAIDLVGHGRSPGRRGCIDSYEQLLDEVHISLEHSRESFPGIPHFLFGHSMGGNLALNLALRRPDDLGGILGMVVGSPMLRAAEMPKESVMDAGRWLATKVPNWRIKTPNVASKLSQDRRAQDAYTRDRWVHRNMSLRLAASLVDSGEWALEHAHLLKSKTLLMHGSDDTLTCPRASSEFAESAGSMVNFKVWYGCRHELHDDLQRERVIDYMTRWMKQQCVMTFRILRPIAAQVA